VIDFKGRALAAFAVLLPFHDPQEPTGNLAARSVIAGGLKTPQGAGRPLQSSLRLCQIRHNRPRRDKPLVWLKGEVKTPPFSEAARIEAGFLLRRLQQGELLALPHSRPMPGIGTRCHELRINDRDQTWRIAYRVETDAVVILDVFSKKTEATPAGVLERCRSRLAAYLRAAEAKEEQ
jgi:phage-related protein